MRTPAELVAFAKGVEGQGVEDHQNCTYTTSELMALAGPLMALPQGATVVEIGVFAGRSASLYLQLQPELNLNLHFIDNWSWNAAMATQEFVKLILAHFSEVPFTLHKMLSAYLAEKWFWPVHFLHVDGWHDMPGIEPDCRLWLPHVLPGGIAAFHDSDSPDVKTCLERYVRSVPRWVLIAEAERTTVWRKRA